MPKITMSKESLEGPPAVPDGLYELRLEGFEPKYSKDKNSVNLRPIIKIVNHPQHAGRQIFDNLNTGAAWILEAFTHSFGLPLVPDGNGGSSLAGEFLGPDDDPTKWNYVGPLSGSVGKMFLKQTEYNGKTNSKVDMYICSVPGCTQKHPSGLAK
jgi:hypothetical protein